MLGHQPGHLDTGHRVHVPFDGERLPTRPATETLVVTLTIVVSTLLIIASHVAISLQSPREPMDERDRSIESRAARNAYYLLLALVAVVIFTPTFWWEAFRVPGLTHQSLLLAFVLAETVRFFSRVVYYPPGAVTMAANPQQPPPPALRRRGE